MSTHLTDPSFWKSFWESKKDLIVEVPENYMFGDLLADRKKQRNATSAIELGGFPGYYAVYLKKYLGLDTTLLDYFIEPSLIAALLKKNGLNETDIRVIEADLFGYDPGVKYDMVLSFGLIEHFSDTRDIIRLHLKFLKPGGTLFITLPNFKSVNGWLQRTADRENYDKHYIGCMDPALLAGIAAELGLKEINVRYHGKFSVWLENRKEKPIATRLLADVIWFTGKALTTLFRIRSPKLAPYIILEARI
jgi:SAM-dependent methyltransferase